VLVLALGLLAVLLGKLEEEGCLLVLKMAGRNGILRDDG